MLLGKLIFGQPQSNTGSIFCRIINGDVGVKLNAVIMKGLNVGEILPLLDFAFSSKQAMPIKIFKNLTKKNHIDEAYHYHRVLSQM